MTIKVIKELPYNGRVLKVGYEFDVTNDKGKELIKEGFVELVGKLKLERKKVKVKKTVINDKD